MSNKNYSVISQDKIGSFNKTIEVDSDKSISIRSFLIGSISQGISEISNILESEDVFSTIKCLSKLNVKIKKVGIKKYQVYGKGIGSLFAKKNTVLDFENSGTCARLLISLIGVTPGLTLRLTGDRSLKKRNMSKLIKIMNEFGTEFYPKGKSYLPLNLISSSMPMGIFYKSGISSQLKSAAILAASHSFSISTILENRNIESRDHTENILLKNSKILKIKKDKNKTLIKVDGNKQIESSKYSVFGDPSTAAFFSAICMLGTNSKLKIKNLGLNPKRTGFFRLMKSHSAKISFNNVIKNRINEIVGDVHVKSCKIKPITAKADMYPSMPDEYPILFVIAALTPGKHFFHGISDLANKESSRAYEMKKVLHQIGVKCKLTKNKMIIYGLKKIKNKNTTIKVGNLLDHRICMATMCLSLITGIKCHIKNFQTVDTSAPSFLKIIKKNLNGKFKIEKK